MKVDDFQTLVSCPVKEWYGAIAEVPCELIKPDPENLRKHFDESDLIDLGKNIALVGQLDEITVFPILSGENTWAGYFDLHDGERRWRASKLVKLPTLRAKIVHRPSTRDLTFKKVSRVLQTRTLKPETKLAALKKSLSDLGVLDRPDEWDSFRERLGGGPEWPQLVRTLRLDRRVLAMFEDGLINFTMAHSVGRLATERQAQVAEFVVVNKISGRSLSTQIVPYLMMNPEANPAQAFEHTRVEGWKQHTNRHSSSDQEPSEQAQLDKFLDACVNWERAWETVVIDGLVHTITDRPQYVHRLKDASRRIQERAEALTERMSSASKETSEHHGALISAQEREGIYDTSLELTDDSVAKNIPS